VIQKLRYAGRYNWIEKCSKRINFIFLGRKALEADVSNGTMWSLACNYFFYADLSRRKGDP
jgi:hypothetical protein